MNSESKNSIVHTLSRRQAGFTLVEMLIVLAIIGLIVGLTTLDLGELFGASKVKTAETWVDGAGAAAVDSYNSLHGNYPASLNDLLVAKDGLPALVKKKSKLTDPWGNPYQYSHPGQHNKDSYDLWTVHEGKTIGNWDGN